MTKFVIVLTLAVVSASAQTKPAFEVATIKPAAPLDMAKMMAAMQAGHPPKIGTRSTPEERSIHTCRSVT